ncbi:MutS-related protein [Pseudobacter ginsenosidimutans]|uniref:MutS-like protein n=1 Tax=Pseudobacter ginsenosidimutans TaxID=661488 RepID=A0A4Q7MZX2_9BACT|nr:DNA mismatch repair protein [Pseudobacter ginsenosidimutans]QEC43464.1 DNA mismatch repair protein [Pseudobacter ginsenosidimutans]RZS74850.1 MutS-like protein [Pseudobacter ginsenosidimutans]
MNFITDEQTLNDLKIFARRGEVSVYALFNHTQTPGGAAILEQLFRYPLSDMSKIEQRSRTIQFFGQSGIQFPFRAEWFIYAEQYLANTDERSRMSGESSGFRRTVNKLMAGDTDFQELSKGIHALTELMYCAKQFITGIWERTIDSAYRKELESFRQILEEEDWQEVWEEGSRKKISYEKIVSLDKLFRFRKRDDLKKLLGFIYQLDVYLSVAGIAAEMQMCFPVIIPADENKLMMEEVKHPLLTGATGNDVQITAKQNVFFLTGANMAGKSTFMKTIGIAIYLAHMGFPVPARNMEFSVRDGLLTTINLPDNLSMGYSHYYGEVLRLKKVVNEMSGSKKMFIVFDELFRGTNVKDAYEATVALLAAFTKRKDCLFLISTHIVEAGHTLLENNDALQFGRLPTKMNGHQPVYTYRLEPGITEDRHGMLIINNEGILDIIRGKQQESINKMS